MLLGINHGNYAIRTPSLDFVSGLSGHTVLFQAYNKVRYKCILTYTFIGDLDLEDICQMADELSQENVVMASGVRESMTTFS